jgi:hypothetical protein
MRSHLRRIAMTASAVSLLGALGAVPAASAANSARLVPAAGGEIHHGHIRFHTNEFLRGSLRMIAEQCVAERSPDRPNLTIPEASTYTIFVSREDVAGCTGKWTESTWTLDVVSPERLKGLVTFHLSQGGFSGAEFRMWCSHPGKFNCRAERDAIELNGF